ncbi:MAG: DUF6766 family protein [Pyrinomonadaceae bacterium]
MKSFFKNNGLSIVLIGFFCFSLAGQYVTGWYEHNEDQRTHRRQPVSFVQYAGEGHFIEALFENWESEFLQMAAFVIFTVFLYQKGSAESKPLNKALRVDRINKSSHLDPKMPWPVRRGGIALEIYKYSLSLALLFLFLVSFVLHGTGGAVEYNQEQLEHGLPAVTTMQYMTGTRFWFESFQNWQSEFLSIAAMVILSIFLRQKGSPESKPVDTPHGETEE